MELTVNEIAALVNKWVEEEHYGWGTFGYSTLGQSYDVPGLGSITIVETEMSGEDSSFEGSDENHPTWVVFSVVGDSPGYMFRKSGCYVSHYGNDWDGPIVRVVAREVTKFVYDRV